MEARGLTLGRAWRRSASVLWLAAAVQAAVCAAGRNVRRSVNYCAELVPTPGTRARAVLELVPVPSPFDVAVTRDGNPRYRIVISIAGLPGAGSRTSIAGVRRVDDDDGLDSVVRLGTVQTDGPCLARPPAITSVF